MSMTPQEIQEKHFHDAFRGYSHEEVDLFLDEVAVAFERLYRENQTFMRRVVDLEEQIKRLQEAVPEPQYVESPSRGLEQDDAVTEGTLKRMLVIAQETADRAVAEAKQRARETQEQSKVRAAEMIDQAETKVAELAELQVRKGQELEEAKEALRKFEVQYRSSFRVFIESQLESLNDLPPAPASSTAESWPEPVDVFREIDVPIGEDLTPSGADSGLPGTQTQGMPGILLEEKIHGGAAGPSQTPAPFASGSESSPGNQASDPNQPSSDSSNDPSSLRSVANKDEKQTREGGDPSRASGSGDEDQLIRELFWGED